SLLPIFHGVIAIDNTSIVIIIRYTKGGAVTNLHFNYKDVFRAGRLGFSAKKMWVTFIGLFFAYIGYAIFAYLSHIIAGISITDVWEMYRIIPLYPDGLPWFCWLVWLVGFLWWICLALLTGVAVSKITFEQLRGDEFYEIKEAIKFTLKSGKSAIFAPVMLIVFMVFIIFAGLFLAVVTLIPYGGQIIFAVAGIPAFAACMFILYLVVVTIVCLIIGPSIVGGTGNDTFDTLFESFSVLNDQPWRFIGYELLLHVLVLVGIAILGYFSAKAVFLVHDVIGVIVSADKLNNIFMNAASYVKITIPPICPETYRSFFVGLIEWIGMPNVLFPPEYIAPFEKWAGAIASFVLAVVYYLIILFVISIGGSIFWAGNTVIFTVLVKKKDDKNLLEIKEELSEDIAPEVTPEKPKTKAKPKKKAKAKKSTRKRKTKKKK
ncbi:MAG: hypothetical protein JSW02_06135, partial [candidate division WOR-3 bacterium]